VITTQIFHRDANGKKRKSMIFHLEHEDNILEKEEEILKHVIDYYKKLFDPSESPTFHLNQNCWEHHEKVSNEENEYLSSQFLMEEFNKWFSLWKKYSPMTRSHASRILSVWMGSDQE
jgi:hypothetical protein